jgi:hypothetical protein
MAITKYASFSNEELLSQLDAKRQHSQIIDELCSRLEKVSSGTLIVDGANKAVRCPVCEAELLADYDGHRDRYELEVAQQ